MGKQYTFRLTAEGVTELKSQMDALGNDGVAAFNKIIAATPGLGSALDAAAKKAEAAHQRLVASTKAEFQSLQASLDPVAAAQQNLAKGRDVVTAAQRVGAATDSEAAAAMAQLEKRYRSAVDGVSLFSRAVGEATKLAGAFGVVLSVDSVVEFGKRVFETTAQLNNQAATIGVSVEAMQAYRAATGAAGLSAADTDAVIQRFTRSIGDASTAVGPARTAFYNLGITAGDLAGGAESALPKVAAALLAINDPAVRAATEIALFGKSGQQIEPALRKFAQSIGDLKDQARAAGLVFDQDLADKAQAASAKIDDATQRLKVSAAPNVIRLTDAISDLIDKAEQLDKLRATFTWGDLFRGLTGGGFTPTGGDAAKPAGGGYLKWPTVEVTPEQTAGNRYGEAEFALYTRQLEEEARLTGLSVQERAAQNEAIKASVELQRLQGAGADSINHTYAAATQVLTAQQLQHFRTLGILTQQNEQADKVRNTFEKTLGSLKQEAQLAGETAQQRDRERAIIAAAQALQQQRGVKERDLVTTYQAGLKVLGDQRAAQVDAVSAQRERNALARDYIDPLREEVSLAGTSRDTREQELEILRLKVQYGKEAVSVSEDEIRALLRAKDIQGVNDRIEDLKEEVKLAGMLPDEAEQYRAVLDEIHASHGNITEDQKQQIQNLVQMGQETQKLQGLVSGIQDGWAEFIDGFLEKGSLNFGNLLTSWKRTFAQWLSQMIAQAIAQPIIIPMVQEVVGSLGGNASAAVQLLGAGATGGSGLLGSINSLGTIGNSLFGGGGISGAINGLGGALGFASPITTSSAIASIEGLGNVSLGVPQTLMAPGSLFGSTSLGGLFGGIGLGSMASSLLFGNKNDAGLGSMAGAGIGTLIGGPIGGLIGGLFGGGLGSLTGSSNHGAWVDLNGDATNFTVTQQGDSANTSSVTQVAQQLTQTVAQLKAAGVSVNNTIRSLMVGGNKDVIQWANGQKQNLSAQNPDELLQTALSALLGSASSSNSSIQSVISSYQGKGGITQSNLSQFLSDIGFANSLNNLDFGGNKLSAIGQALKQINDQADALVSKAQEIGQDTGTIEAARQHAIQGVIDDFSDGITAGIKQLGDPIGAAIDTIVKAQQQRLDDAKTLGIDAGDVLRLNAAESKSVLQQYLSPLQDMADNGLSDYERQMKAVDQAVKDATEAANALGLGLGDVNSAADAARAAIKDAVNSQSGSAKASLASLVQDLVGGSDSALSPDKKYFNLLTQYNAAAATALGSPNDATALGNFQNAAQSLLPVAREFLGSSQAYGRLSSSILSTATQLGGDLADPSGVGRAMVMATSAGSTAIVNAIGTTNDNLRDLSDKFSRLEAQLAAVINRSAAA